MRRLASGLSKRFGKDFAKVGMYPIPILTRDIPGYRITPHTDTQCKGITVQFYLPNANTDIGTIFHEKLADGSMPKRAQMRFAPKPAMPSRSVTILGIPPIGCTMASKLATRFCSPISSTTGCCGSCATAESGSPISCSTNCASICLCEGGPVCALKPP
jgi:hypothetical protein